MKTYGVFSNNGFNDRSKVERTIRQLHAVHGREFSILHQIVSNPVHDIIYGMTFDLHMSRTMTDTDSKIIDGSDEIIIFARKNLTLFQSIIRYAETMEKPVKVYYQYPPEWNSSHRHALELP